MEGDCVCVMDILLGAGECSLSAGRLTCDPAIQQILKKEDKEALKSHLQHRGSILLINTDHGI